MSNFQKLVLKLAVGLVVATLIGKTYQAGKTIEAKIDSL
jgi:hypothetical protein